MAITTIAGAIAGLQPTMSFLKSGSTVNLKPTSFWASGIAPTGTYDSTLNGVVLSQTAALVTGAIPFRDPPSGNAYLGRFQAAGSTGGPGGKIILCDRLWHNGGYTITSSGAQNSTTPTWPARDVAGATSGDGVLLGLEISAAAGAAAPTITVAYTNSAGTNTRSGVNLDATANSPAVRSFFRIGLQAGDTGVQSVQSLTLSTSWLSGTMNLVAYRVLAELELDAQSQSKAIDAFTAGLPRLYAGTTPFLLAISPNGLSAVSGTFTQTNG